MADKHSFDSEISKQHSFETELSNVHTFNSYIRNVQSFGNYPTTEWVAPANWFWFIKFTSRFLMSIASVLSTQTLNLKIIVPEILSSINSALVKVEQTIRDNIIIVIPAPVMSLIVRSLQKLSTTITLPTSMTAVMRHSNNLADTVLLPTIQMSMLTGTSQYYLVSYYDATLVSDLDGSILEDMDAVDVIA